MDTIKVLELFSGTGSIRKICKSYKKYTDRSYSLNEKHSIPPLLVKKLLSDF